MWFTETSWTPIILMCVVSIGLLFYFASTKRGLYLMGALLLWAGCVGVYFIEQSIITESEQVEQAILDVSSAFQSGNKATILSFFSEFAVIERAIIETQTGHIKVQDDLRITDMTVTLVDEKNALSEFRANGSVVVTGYGRSGRYPTRWRFRWMKEKTGWKITKANRLDPINGKVIEFMHRD